MSRVLNLGKVKGENGKSLEFEWSGTQLGIRQEGTDTYSFVDLKGEAGPRGPAGPSYDDTEIREELAKKQNTLVAGENITIEGNVISSTGGGGTGDTTDYTALSNKPKINGIELTGNKTSANLGLAPATHSHTKDEITGLTIPTNTSDLTNDSDFISSTVVTAFWSGTQAEYESLTS